MLSETYLLRLPEHQRKALPAVSAACYISSHGFILAAIDAAIRELADRNPAIAGAVKLATQPEHETVIA